MSGELWVVRAGPHATYVDEFEAGSYIAVGFDGVSDDDLALTHEAALKAHALSPTERNAAAQLTTFAYRLQVDDLVIVPRLTASHRDYLVGRITGPYQHIAVRPPSGHHQRPVAWLGTFNRDALTPAAANTLGSILTVFRPTAVEAELRNLLTALIVLEGYPPLSPTGTSPTPHLAQQPRAAPLTREQLDISLDDSGRASITSAHPALVMEQTSRHIDPTRDWDGEPGIYVLTGTHLDQSSARTGNERTLTTTSIVRPWAYVGLSEDFRGRLSSHRQSKPEWRRALLVRSGAQPFGSDDIKYLEHKVHAVLEGTGEVFLNQATPRGNLSAQPRNPSMLDACADTVVAVLRLTGTLI